MPIFAISKSMPEDFSGRTGNTIRSKRRSLRFRRCFANRRSFAACSDRCPTTTSWTWCRAPVKLPQQLKPATGPGTNGEDLVSFLFSLRESHRDRFEAIEDTLKVAFPGFESLQFPPVAAGMLSLTWRDKHFREPIYVHQLSEGTLRFLWLIAILQSPQPATLTMIDEPEVSLHPELIALLADLLREASQRTQILVATHSDRLVRFLEPREVVVMDLDGRDLQQQPGRIRSSSRIGCRSTPSTSFGARDEWAAVRENRDSG